MTGVLNIRTDNPRDVLLENDPEVQQLSQEKAQGNTDVEEKYRWEGVDAMKRKNYV